jgi:hypothetical protein
MPSPGMLHCVALARTDVSVERSPYIKRVTRIGDLEINLAVRFSHSISSQRASLLVTANVVPSSLILVTLMIEELRSSETSVLTRSTRRHIPEDGALRSRYTDDATAAPTFAGV